MAKKILMAVMFGVILFSMTFISSLDSFNTVKQAEEIRISQICNGATYITISSIAYPNSTVAISGINMTSSGSGEFYYFFNLTNELGRYDVKGISDGCEKTFAVYFEVTPSGKSGIDNIFFIILIIVVVYGITLLGFFKQSPIITLIGGMFMLFIGVYFINNGIIIYRDTLTNYFSYFTIALGAITALGLAIFLIEDSM